MKTPDKNPLKKRETNIFGGGNKLATYVPLTDVELEVLERLALGGDFSLVIREWGTVKNFKYQKVDPNTWNGTPSVYFGDKRISFWFVMNLKRPEMPQPNYYFDIEVWARGRKLFQAKHDTTYGGKPIEVVRGLQLGIAFDVALHSISPELIKQIKPGTFGLTSRHGNMDLDANKARTLHNLLKSEKQVREDTRKRAESAQKRQEGKT